MSITIMQITVTIFSIYAIIITSRNKKISIIKKVFWNTIWSGLLMMTWTPGLISLVTRTNSADLIIRISVIALFYMTFLLDTKINDMKEDVKKLC